MCILRCSMLSALLARGWSSLKLVRLGLQRKFLETFVEYVLTGRYGIDRSGNDIRYFWIHAQVQCQKWLAAVKTFNAVLLKSSGHNLTEVYVVAVTQKP